jgi:hypothetical protein
MSHVAAGQFHVVKEHGRSWPSGRMKGQQLKEQSQLDGRLRDGPAACVKLLCEGR